MDLDIELNTIPLDTVKSSSPPSGCGRTMHLPLRSEPPIQDSTAGAVACGIAF
jgi:hypothetical protein